MALLPFLALLGAGKRSSPKHSPNIQTAILLSMWVAVNVEMRYVINASDGICLLRFVSQMAEVLMEVSTLSYLVSCPKLISFISIL